MRTPAIYFARLWFVWPLQAGRSAISIREVRTSQRRLPAQGLLQWVRLLLEIGKSFFNASEVSWYTTTESIQ